jgi:hypothetical protein
MTNMTYAQAIDFAVENIDNIDVIEKLQALKAQLAKRSTSKTPTKTQKENVLVMEQLEKALYVAHDPVTVTELINSTEALKGYTNQKVSALLRKMVDNGKVVKTIEGRKAKFALA